MATFPPGQLDPSQPQRKPPNAPGAVAFSPSQMDPREQFEDGSGPVAEGEAAKRKIPDPGNGIVIDPGDLDIHDGGPYDDKSGGEPDEDQAKAAPARPQLAVVNQPAPRPQLVSDKTPPPEPLDPELLKAMRERLGPSLETEYKATVAKREAAAGLSELQERARALGIEIAPETPEGEKPDAETGFEIDDEDSAVTRSLKQAYNTIEPFLSGVGAVASDIGTAITKDAANIVLGGPLRAYRNALNYLTEGRNAIQSWIKSQIGEERFAELEKQSADEMAKTLGPLYMQELRKIRAGMDSGKKGIGDLTVERSGVPGVETVMSDAESVTGQMAQSITQFMTFYLAMGPSTVAGALGAGAVSDFAAFKAADGNFANLIQMLPGMEKNALLEYLATDETTPETEGRLKNALTGALGGVIAEAVFMYARGYKARQKARELAGTDDDEGAVKKAVRTVQDSDLRENPPIAETDIGKRASELLGGEPDDMPLRLEQRLKPVHFDVPTQIVAKAIAGDIPRIPPPQPGFKRVWSASEANIADRVEKFAPVVRGYYDTPEEATRAAGIEKFEPSRELTYVDIPEADYSRVRQGQIEAGYGPSMVGRTFTAGLAIRVRAFQENRLPSWVNQDGKAPAIVDPNFKSAADLKTAKKPTRPAKPDLSDGVDESDIRSYIDMGDYIREFRKRKPPTRLAEFLKSAGGLKNQGDEVRTILGAANQRPGLIHQNGMDLDEAARRAWDAGYLEGVDRPDVNALLDRLRDDLGVDPVYSARDGDYLDDLRIVEEMEQELDQLGLNARSSADAIRRTLASDPQYQGSRLARPEADQETPIEAAGPARVGAPPPLPEIIESDFFNFNRIDSSDDLKVVIRDMAEAFSDDFDVSKGVRSFKQIEKESRGYDPVNTLLRDREGGLPSDAEVFALRRLHAASADKLKELAQAALNGGPAEEFALMRMVQIHRLVQAEVKNIGTAYARGLAQFRMAAGGGKEQAQQIQQILDRTGGSKTAKRVAAEIVNLPDNDAAALALDKAVRDMGGRRLTAQVVGEVWRNAILSGPKTHMVNALSNSLVMQYQILERAVAGQFGDLLSPVSGVKMQEAALMAHAQRQAWKELFSYAWRTSLSKAKLAKMADDAPDLFARYKDQFDKLEQPYPRAISSERMGLDGNAFGGKAIDLLGAFINTPGTMLGGADVVFKFVNERMQIHALAARMALKEMEEGVITPQAVKKRIADIIEEPPEEIRMQARNFAALQTFTGDPGPIAKEIMKFKSAVDEYGARNVGIPIGTMLLPFVNTPANILSYTFDRTPLAPLGAKFRAAVKAGGAERDLALARVTLGSTIAVTAFDMAMDGHITGGGPSDPRQRATLRRNGWQPYSIRFQAGQHDDGKPIYRYFAVNRMDPIGSWLVLAAEAAEVARGNGGRLDPELNEFMAAISFGIAKIVTEKTYLTGVSRVIDAINHPDRNAEYWLNSMAGSFVPAGVAEWARAIDPVMRHAHDISTSLRRRTPGLSSEVPPRLDLWGREIKYQSGLGIIFDIISPIYSDTTERAQPIDRVFMELNYFPRSPSTFKSDGKTVPLRNFPEARNKWIRLRAATPASQLVRANAEDIPGSVRKGLERYGDDTLLETLNKVVEGKHPSLSTEYQLEDGEGKRRFLSKIISHYNRGAKPQVWREHPELKQAWDRIPALSERGQEAPF
jgi:hypothetical protein